MRLLSLLFIAVIACTSCKQKKIIVYSKGKAVVDTDKKTIRTKDDGANEETPVDITTGAAKYIVTTTEGESTVDLPNTGLYIINAKNDTLIGGRQYYTDVATSQRTITQVELKHKIDSIIDLTTGKNISEANKNYFLLPRTAARISDNVNAMVVGPYHRMRSAEKVDGKDPEVYHFYSIKEIREKITEMQALTVGEKF